MYNPYEDNNQNNQENSYNPNEANPMNSVNGTNSSNPMNPYETNVTEQPTPPESTNPTTWHIPSNTPADSGFQTYNTFAGGNPYGGTTAAELKPKKDRKALKIAALIVACALVSTACGLGGSMISQKMNGGTTNKTSVLTQSLVNTSNTAGSTSSVAQVAEAAADSVVEITTESVSTDQYLQQYVSEGAGSGVIISTDGYIITNNHVISGANKITVTTRDGQSYQGKLVGTDEDSDVAVVKIEATGLKAAVFGDSEKLTVGEQAVAIGNPLGSLGGTVTEGIISALDREITIDGKTMHLLQTSAAINPGNSGGGLFNSSGELIGIVNAKTSASGIEGLGFAIPVNTAKKIAEDLMENGYVTGKVKLGVTLLNIADDQTAMQYRVSETGVYISNVEANSDAYYGGLKSGDRIISVNGEEITTSSQVQEVITNSSVGDKLTFKISRSNAEETVEITLTEYNSGLSAFNS